METQDKRYSVYLKIGDNEMALSGEDKEFIKQMLDEFKDLFVQAVSKKPAKTQPTTKPRKPTEKPERVVKAAGTLSQVAEPITSLAAEPAREPETSRYGKFAELVKELKPSTAIEEVLLLLYYIKEYEDGRALKPKEMMEILRAVGIEPVKGFSSNLGYMKRRGFVRREPKRGWFITSDGVDRVLKLIRKSKK